MQGSSLPQTLRTARVITYVQGGLGLLNGAFLVFGGVAYAKALNLTTSGGAALIQAIGVVVVIVSALLIWAGTLLGRVSRRARAGILVYEYVSVALGLLSLQADPLQAGLRVVLAAVVIYYLQFARETKALFASQRPDAVTEDTSPR
ncbi:MAG: hypothetical protein JF887_08235 [Candidatus Dormibacteraeota bacterium]|uniref:DUF2127 domain-containing protein n=1 Tax=Candidatus Amunia macphersoniae TaxID=3127014 RepID=A0A934KF99_9BACT|nr:hypothetical protein [Candidatus Dormibacteraeota bacterium]